MSEYMTEIQIISDTHLDLDYIGELIMKGHKKAIDDGMRISIMSKQKVLE